MSKTKAQELADKIKAMKGTDGTKSENIKIEKEKETIPKIDRRKFNHPGPGSGRKPGGTALQTRLLKELMKDHCNEEIEVTMMDKKTGKIVTIKKPRLIIAMEKLYQIGIKEDGNDAAIDKWLNRAVGKAPQPLVWDEDEAPIRVDKQDMDRLLDKAYGDD